MENIQEKIEFLKANGVEDWEIEAVTRHGSSDFRRIVSESMELSPWEAPMDDAQATDVAELAAMAQRKAVEPRDISLAQGGRMPESMLGTAIKFRETLGLLPSAAVLEPSNLENTENVLKNTGEALRHGLKEEMRTAPIPEPEADILGLEAAYMEQRGLREQLKSQRAQREELQLKAFVPGERPAMVGDYDINNDWFGLAGEFLPRTTKDFYDWTNAWIEAGLLPDDIWTRVTGSFLARGTTGEEVLEMLDKMSPEEQSNALKKFVDIYSKSLPPHLRSDFNVYLALQDTYSDRYVETGEVKSDFERRLLNVVGWLGAVEVVAGASLITRPIKAGLRMLAQSRSVTRLAQMQNPVWYAEALRKAFNEMPEAAVNKYMNTTKVDIAQSQLPGPATGERLVNIPDGVIEPRELERITEATEAALDTSRRLTANVYSSKEQGLIINNVIEEIQAANTGRLRLGMSEVAFKDDLSGVNLNMMIGADEKVGFKSLDEAVDYGMNELGLGVQHEYFKVMPDGTLEQIKPVLKQEDGKWINSAPATPGEYLIRAKYEHTFSAADARLFDGTPVIAGGWMGRFLGRFNTPSSFLDTNTVGKFTRAYLKEQALVNQLDSIIAPLYKGTTPNQRLLVNDAMMWAEKYGEEFGIMPTVDELKLKFPEMGKREVELFYTARHFQDTLYEIQNARLYQNWNARSFKTVSKPDVQTQYHGKPLELNEIRGSSFLDPETGKSRNLAPDEIEDLYTRGGSIVEIELPMQGSPGQAHRLVLVDPEMGWNKNTLRRHVLEYRPGYNTRIYEDAHFVQRVKKNARIDGATERHVSTMRTATTAKEAEIFQRRVIDALGRKLYKDEWDKNAPLELKRKLLDDKGYDIVVSRDARLSDADRIKVDVEKMQVEGRLFFDNRQKTPLRNTDNKPSELVDPIESMQRVARMAARQVSTEGLADAQKSQFFGRYKSIGLNSRKTSAEIDADLVSIVKQGSKEERAMASEALGWWRYIRFMEGSMNTSPSAFRGAAIKAAESLDYNIGKKIGARRLTKWVSRDLASNASVVNASKQLAFLHFLTARPLRQLVLQGAQHLNLQAIDPLYIGRWQMDSWSLLAAMKRLTNSREDNLISALKLGQMRRIMGFDEDEMNILLREFSQSGLVDGVDVHSYAGGLPKASISTSNNRAIQEIQGVGHGIRWPVDKARALGFDLGEQYNVSASYMLGLRRHMKENGIKSVKSMDSNDWDLVANRGSQYALAMHKANAATWQYGLFSLPLQFLQFTHKWLLTTMGASKTMRNVGLANQQFTQGEAAKILAGQAIMWGGAGFGLKEVVNQAFNSSPEVSAMVTEQEREYLTSGFVDMLLDKSMQMLFDDEELDFAFEDTFAPSMGGYMLFEKIMELGTEPTMLYEPLLGPSGEILSRYTQAFRLGQAMMGKDFEHWEPAKRAEAVIEAAAAGLFAGYSDLLKARLAMKVGQWTNTAGVPTGLEARWGEVVLKGALGLNPEKLLSYYRVTGKIGDLQSSVKEDAKTHAETINKLVIQWSDNKLGEEDFLAQINTVSSVYELYKEDGLGELYYDAFMQEFDRLKSLDGERLANKIKDTMLRGYTGEPIIDGVRSGVVPPEHQDTLNQWLNRMLSTQDKNIQDRRELLEIEKQFTREMTDGE
jgi:hypothetical protein